MMKNQKTVALGSLKTQKKKNELSKLKKAFGLFFLYLPITVSAQLDEFNEELETAADGLDETALLVLRIVKIIAGLGALVGLIVFIVYRNGNQDLAGTAGKWSIGIVLFIVGLSVLQKLFLQ